MNDAEKLADLKDHWGSAYNVWRGNGNSWCARYRATPRDEPLVAYRADNLRQLIRADYDQRTVPTGRPTGPASPRTSSQSPQ